MLSTIFNYALIAAAVVAFLVLRQMAVRRVRRMVESTGVHRNRSFQFGVLGLVAFALIWQLGVISIVFVALFLVVGTGLKIASLFGRGRSPQG